MTLTPSSPSPTSIDFFFDLSSPYSYLAATQMEGLAARTGTAVRWRPFVLGAVFKAANNVLASRSPAKDAYQLKDLARWAAAYGVPYRWTSHFPLNAMKAHRLILVAERSSPAQGIRLAQAAYAALWAEDRDLTDDAVLGELAAQVELDPAAALGATADPEIKDRLRANTDDAIRRGAFGSPTIFIGEELYWGNDRLHQVEAALLTSRSG